MNTLLLSLFVAVPNAALIDVDGPELLDEVRRSAEPLVLINVWATSCGPCVTELPMFVETEKKYRGRVRFMFVSADFREDRPLAEKLISAKGATLPSYFRRGRDQTFIETLHPKWNGTLPATFVFGKSGQRLGFWVGSMSERELTGELDQLLASAAR